MTNQLEQIKKYSVIVADTGDIEAIKKYCPIDATTNPALILKASTLPIYSNLLQESIRWTQAHNMSDDFLSSACHWLTVTIGKNILEYIPGKVSTEIDARLSFDKEKTIKQAHIIHNLYQQYGIDSDKILIKIAATWEGIEAAKLLEKEGIHCNLTLLFSFEQAQACADAGVFLISPFVGRITDWYKKHQNVDSFAAEYDPGILSVKRIYNYYKAHNYDTVIMAASFRHIGQITALAGCDRLTISPSLLEELQNNTTPIPLELSPEKAVMNENKTLLDESSFRWHLNENIMATEKLAEGIRLFAQATRELEGKLKKLSHEFI